MLLLDTKLFSSHGGYLTNAMYHHRETIKSNEHTMMKKAKKKKKAHDSHIARAKENLKLSYIGASQRQASCTNQRMEALRQF